VFNSASQCVHISCARVPGLVALLKQCCRSTDAAPDAGQHSFGLLQHFLGCLTLACTCMRKRRFCCHPADPISASSDRHLTDPCRTAALTSIDTPLPSRLIVSVPSGTTVENVSPLNCKPGRTASAGSQAQKMLHQQQQQCVLCKAMHRSYLTQFDTTTCVNDVGHLDQQCVCE
jgi:hypothetical protein